MELVSDREVSSIKETEESSTNFEGHPSFKSSRIEIFREYFSSFQTADYFHSFKNSLLMYVLLRSA